MEDGAQLVVLEREEVDIPWGFNVVPCPDGVARITQVKSGGLADNFGLCDGDQVLQVGRMKVDPRDGLNLGNVEMLLRMPTPQLEIVVFRDDFLDRNLGSIVPKKKLQEFRPLPRQESETDSADDEKEIIPSVPVKALSEYWEHPDQEGFEPTKPTPGHLPPERIEIDEWQRRDALLRQQRYEEQRRQDEAFERQKFADVRHDQKQEQQYQAIGKTDTVSAMADQGQDNVRTVEETLPDGTKIIRRIITKKAGQGTPIPMSDGEREVQEFEDVLPDGTKVIRRVIRTKRPAQQIQQIQQQNDENIRQVEETLPDGTKVIRTYRTVKKQMHQEESMEPQDDDGDDDRVQLHQTASQQQTQEVQQQQTQRIQQTEQQQTVQQTTITQRQQIERREVHEMTHEVHETRSRSPPPRTIEAAPEPRQAPKPSPRSRSPPPRPLQAAPELQRPQQQPRGGSPPPRVLGQAPEPRQPQGQLQQSPSQSHSETPKASTAAPEQQPTAMQRPPATPGTQRRADRNWEEQQKREFKEYLRIREQQGPPPQGPKSNADYVSKYQEQLLKRRPSQGGHQPGSIEDYRKQYERSTRRESTPTSAPLPGSNTEYLRMYEETLKKKEEYDRQRAEDRFEKAQGRTQEEYKRFYEDELRRKQILELEQEEERRRYLEEQSKQRENISRSKELYQQQLQKDMQKKEHLITRPTGLRPERVGAQANHWERIADEERIKMNFKVPPSPKVQRKNLDACWPPKREDGVLVRPAFSRENSFHGSSRKVYQWPPPRASSIDRDYERPPTPTGGFKHDINWNQQRERESMTTPPPFARSPQVGRRNVVWPPPSPTMEHKTSFEPGQRRGSQTASLEDYLSQQRNPAHIPATYRPPPGTSHHEDHDS
ncbi:serine/arginine repetitive matrix protein 1-like isoform X2 [Varroa jacobsoni]|uniref:serine/arginine repetitive matrix protein 1-like isoform X2 n=1 Tax=Varroa jacobsoni TaxID=62625 RepID=UPI000BF4D675|nr:serine/arginine repetitive matrix protein 1-like isoform X2 [Varroa jacobsoni]